MKSQFRFMKGNILVFMVTNIVWFFAMRISYPYFSLFVLELGGTATAIGFVGVFRALASLFTYPIAGHMADRMGRVRLTGISRIFYCLMFLFYIFAPNWIVLAAGSFCLGFIVFHFPAQSAIMADSLPPKQRGIGFATLMAVPGAVAIVGPYIGAYVITQYGINLGVRYLYTITLVCGVAIGVIRLKFLKETLRKPESRMHLKVVPSLIKEAYSGVWETLKWMPKSLKALTLIIAISLFFNSVAGPFWIIYGVNVIKLTELEWGLIMLLVGGLQVGLSIPAGIMVDRFGTKRVIVAALALSVFPVFFFVYCRLFLQTLIVLLVITVANAFLQPACFTLLADIVPKKRRGRVMAALGQGMLMVAAQGGGGGGGPGIGSLLTIPVILGFLVSGFVYSFNPTYPWIFLSLGLILCLILTTIFIKETESPEL